jgi:peroxiredoxin
MIAVILLGTAWTWVSAVPTGAVTSGRIPAPREGFEAPGFQLELLGGGEVRLADLRGQVVIINLWASWCPPCRAEMPALQRTYAQNRDRGLEVLAVNMTFQDSPSAAAAFVQEHGLGFKVPLDVEGEVGRLYQLRALPTTFFVDRQGIIRQVVVGGPMSEGTIQTAITELLEERP